MARTCIIITCRLHFSGKNQLLVAINFVLFLRSATARRYDACFSFFRGMSLCKGVKLRSGAVSRKQKEPTLRPSTCYMDPIRLALSIVSLPSISRCLTAALLLCGYFRDEINENLQESSGKRLLKLESEGMISVFKLASRVVYYAWALLIERSPSVVAIR